MAAILPSGMRADLDRNLARNRRRRLHPAERPGRRASCRDATDEAEKARARVRTSSETILTNVRVLAIDQTRRGEGRPARRGRQDRDARAPPRQAEPLALSRQTRHAVARAAQPRRRRQGDDQVRATTSASATAINTVRFGVSTMAHPMSFGGDEQHGDSALIRTAALVAAARRRRWRSLGAGRRADALPALDSRVPILQIAGERSQLALRAARHRQVGGDRPAGRHQGRAGRRSQDRQCGRALGAARLLIGVAVGQTNVYFFDARGPPDRRLRHRRDARPQRRARRAAGACCRMPTCGSKASATASCCRARSSSPAEAQQAYDVAAAAGRRRQQGRQRHHRARPRPGHAQGHGRRGAARRHQAARHRSQRAASATAPRCSTSTTPIRSPPSARRCQQRRRASGSFNERHRDAARDGARRRHPHAGRAEPHARSPAKARPSWPAASFPIPAGLTCDPTNRRRSVRPRSSSRNSASA